MIINSASRIKGEVTLSGDKSISHRAAIISIISKNSVVIKNFLFSEDCINTLKVIKKLGVSVEKLDNSIIVHGKGIDSLKEPDDILYVGNAGTAIRLLAGVLSATGFISVLSGDRSINSRPMGRIINPLREMNANIYGRENNTKAPIIIIGNKKLKGKSFTINVSSAQVKSCIALASLFAEGKTEIIQPAVSRDHTERMLEYFGADIEYNGKHTKIIPGRPIEGKDIFIPGDISSAAYLIVASLILNNSYLTIRNVSINPTRTYFIELLRKMGAKINIYNQHVLNNEPVGDISAYSSSLHGIKIEKKVIPSIIDEIPVLSVAASFAEGKTVISGADELRVKESDRIYSICSQFKKLGVNIKEKSDGIIIEGSRDLMVKEGTVDCMEDHRIAMSLAILGLRSKGKIRIIDSGCIDTSFPDFKYELKKLLN